MNEYNSYSSDREQQYQQYGYYNVPGGSPFDPSPQPPKKKRTALKVVAVIALCLVFSIGSVGGFIALLRTGAITFNEISESETSSVSSMIEQVRQENSDGALSLQEVAAKVTPSVVCIQNYQTSRFGESVKASEGSGIIASEDGYIITNEHVVAGADNLNVILFDGTEYKARFIGSDRATDLALIKINASNLAVATFGDADELNVGDQMIAIGNPGGITLNSSVTFGYVSALNRSIETNNGYTVNCIQTDAAINPGNSGGALVNIYGQVVGINSSKIAATGYEGLGFAISINEALPVIESLREYGYVTDRPLIGVSYQFIDETTSYYYRIPVGVYITGVLTENAERAGLQQGDVITAIDDHELSSTSVFAQALQDKKPGDTVELTLYKGETGNTVTVRLVLSSYDSEE